MTDRAALADKLEALWRRAQIDYPLQMFNRGAWITIKDHDGNYLCTVRNRNDAQFIESLLESWPEILKALRNP